MDAVSKETRSRIMASIRPRGNLTTEIALGSRMWADGIRGYRKHWKVFGSPDFAWPSLKLAVFVDGCFWHGCKNCYRTPASNSEYWDKKIERNRARDRRVSQKLRKDGWSVIRIRECMVKKASTISRIRGALKMRQHLFLNQGDVGTLHP